eukprot:13649333-Heterocapsa_arctica.AAC.1
MAKATATFGLPPARERLMGCSWPPSMEKATATFGMPPARARLMGCSWPPSMEKATATFSLLSLAPSLVQGRSSGLPVV